MLAQEGFVGGDDVLSRLQTAPHDVISRHGSTHQVQDHRHLAVIADFLPIISQYARGQGHVARAVWVLDHRMLEPDVAACASAQPFRMVEQNLGDPAADGPHAYDGHVNQCHKPIR